MNELNLRRICAKIDIGKQKPNFFNKPYKIKVVLDRPLDTGNLKLDALSIKYTQSSNIASRSYA
jgi:hypothetical protein